MKRYQIFLRIPENCVQNLTLVFAEPKASILNRKAILGQTNDKLQDFVEIKFLHTDGRFFRE